MADEEKGIMKMLTMIIGTFQNKTKTDFEGILTRNVLRLMYKTVS